jgi:hypothetical protein
MAPATNYSLRHARLFTERPVILIGTGMPARHDELDEFACAEALRLFREERLDNVDIAWRLECTPAAAANGIASARELERRAT